MKKQDGQRRGAEEGRRCYVIPRHAGPLWHPSIYIRVRECVCGSMCGFWLPLCPGQNCKKSLLWRAWQAGLPSHNLLNMMGSDGQTVTCGCRGDLLLRLKHSTGQFQHDCTYDGVLAKINMCIDKSYSLYVFNCLKVIWAFLFFISFHKTL